MTAYVVTPNGELLIYLNATKHEHVNGGDHRFKDKEGHWIADIPQAWAVGWQRPQYSVPSSALADIKRALRNFDMRTGRFKP